MTIEQFAKSALEQENNAPPLLQALQALRSCDLDQLRDPKHGLLCDGWIPWSENTPAQTPESYVKRPELRC